MHVYFACYNQHELIDKLRELAKSELSTFPTRQMWLRNGRKLTSKWPTRNVVFLGQHTAVVFITCTSAQSLRRQQHSDTTRNKQFTFNIDDLEFFELNTKEQRNCFTTYTHPHFVSCFSYSLL